MDGKRGQFLSQDPVFWEMGQGTPDSIAVLKNPQAQNSYSYGQNNPIVNKDPDGRIAFLAAPVLIGGGVVFLGGIGGQMLEICLNLKARTRWLVVLQEFWGQMPGLILVTQDQITGKS